MTNMNSRARCPVLARCLATALCALAPGCVSVPPESAQQVRTDQATARRVYAALESDRMHLYIGLEVRVQAGVAYVSALTFDPAVRDAATQIVRSVPGVTRVVNQIEVSAGSAH
jgi:osmotically-inducible protein OsmY